MKLTWKQMIRRRISAHRLGIGMALGTFVSIVMPYSTHLPTALFFAWLLRVDKASTALGTLANNPLTAVPIYLGGWWIGCTLLHADPHAWVPHGFTFTEMLQFIHSLSQAILMPLLLGLLVVGSGCSFIAYYATKISVDWMRSKRRLARRSIQEGMK